MKRATMRDTRKGFTLIELIVTIAILAILVTIVVIAINPAEQLARSRDAKRVSDLDTMRSAWNLYLAQATGTVNLSGDSTANNRCVGGGGTITLFLSGGSMATTSPFTAIATGTQDVATTTSASSWAPALVGQTPGGAPVSNLPIDPTNTCSTNAGLCYRYACRFSNKTFEFSAVLESSYFKTDLNLIGTDGGNSSSTYEVGTDLTITPNAY